MSRNRIAGKWMTGLLGLILASALIGPGCRQNEQEADSAAETSPADEPLAIIEDPAPRLVAADEQDAEDAPFFLPRTDTLRDWVKTQPVRTGRAQAAAQMVESNVAEILDTFRIERVSVCTYEQPELRAEVLAVEARTPEDAFGMFSLLADGKWMAGGDRSIRARVGTAGPVWYGWQGRCLVRVRGEAGINTEMEKALADLLGMIVFYIPAEDAPLLARAIPPAHRAESRVWVVRDLRPLRASYAEQFGNIDAQAMNEILGLTGAVLFSVARVRQAQNNSEDLIWLAEYPNAGAARAAYGRYRKALEDADDGHTLLLEPRGVFFVGGWAGRGEQVQRVLNELREALPSDVTQP